MLTFACIVLACWSIAATLLLWIAVNKNLYLEDKFADMKNAVLSSLDVLDGCYQRMDAKTKLELFLDEPVVKETVADIKRSRDAVLLVASCIVEPINENEE